MSYRVYILAAGLSLFLAACQSVGTVCPTEEGTPEPTIDLAVLLEYSPTSGPTPSPAAVEIGGKTITVDRVISGPLCNDTWKGTVYVSCDLQVAPWENDETPLFFEHCKLDIEPGTIVYVADHNDAAYYKGCSCHTGEVESP